MKNIKIILIKRQTRLEELIYRYNTLEQVKFLLESQNADFKDYLKENETYQKALKDSEEILSKFGKVQILDRKFLANFIFSKNDIVVAIGQDGLVANVMKYLKNHFLIGVNPDPDRFDGILLPFKTKDLKLIFPDLLKEKRKIKEITMAKVELKDRQRLYAVNDFFIGQKTHVSARYEIKSGQKKERQSSSGIIVSTGLGSTGWLKSILQGASKIAGHFTNPSLNINHKLTWDTDKLYFSVREPYPSKFTQADLVFGEIKRKQPLFIASNMSENGVIFSDGMEEDFLVFNSGAQAEVKIADRKGILVF